MVLIMMGAVFTAAILRRVFTTQRYSWLGIGCRSSRKYDNEGVNINLLDLVYEMLYGI